MTVHDSSATASLFPSPSFHSTCSHRSFGIAHARRGIRLPPGVPLAASEQVGRVTQAVVVYGLVEFVLPLSQLRTHSQARKKHAFRPTCTHQSVSRPGNIKVQTDRHLPEPYSHS